MEEGEEEALLYDDDGRAPLREDEEDEEEEEEEEEGEEEEGGLGDGPFFSLGVVGKEDEELDEKDQGANLQGIAQVLVSEGERGMELPSAVRSLRDGGVG